MAPVPSPEWTLLCPVQHRQASEARSRAAADLVGSPGQVKEHSLSDAPIVSSAPGSKAGIEAELVLTEKGDILAMETLATVSCDGRCTPKQALQGAEGTYIPRHGEGAFRGLQQGLATPQAQGLPEHQGRSSCTVTPQEWKCVESRL